MKKVNGFPVFPDPSYEGNRKPEKINEKEKKVENEEVTEEKGYEEYDGYEQYEKHKKYKKYKQYNEEEVDTEEELKKFKEEEEGRIEEKYKELITTEKGLHYWESMQVGSDEDLKHRQQQVKNLKQQRQKVSKHLRKLLLIREINQLFEEVDFWENLELKPDEEELQKRRAKRIAALNRESSKLLEELSNMY